MRLRTWILATSALALCSLPGPRELDACIHGRRRQPIQNGGYRGLIVHAGDREELILDLALKFGKRKSKEPVELGWVVALPAVPDAYSASVDSAIFKELLDLKRRFIPRRKTRGRRSRKAGGGLRVTRLEVGPYVIHQLKVTGSEAVTALNRWFKDNDFAEKDPSEMRFFIDRGYTFVCVRAAVTMSRGSSSPMPPLRLSFKADRPFFPLKFSSHGGVFPLSLFVLSEKPLAWRASAESLYQLGWSELKGFASPGRGNHEVEASALTGALGKLLAAIRSEGRVKEPAKFHFNHLDCGLINTPYRPIEEWRRDLWLEVDRDPHRAEIMEHLQALSTAPRYAEPHRQAILKLKSKALPTLHEMALVTGDSKMREIAKDLISEVYGG